MVSIKVLCAGSHLRHMRNCLGAIGRNIGKLRTLLITIYRMQQVLYLNVEGLCEFMVTVAIYAQY